MNGQVSLNNFLQSVRFQNPALADRIMPDCVTVSLYGLSADKTPGQEAADRLRREAFDMPVIHARVLESALSELGF